MHSVFSSGGKSRWRAKAIPRMGERGGLHSKVVSVIRRYSALLMLPLVALLATGCEQVEQAASDAVDQAANAASEAVSQAASDLANAAVGEAVKQVCAPIQDGSIGPEEQELLGGLVSAADAAGVPAEITGPMSQIAESGDQIPADTIASMQQACDEYSAQ